MSRIGKMPIRLADQAQVEVKENMINVTGPKGRFLRLWSMRLSFRLPTAP